MLVVLMAVVVSLRMVQRYECICYRFRYYSETQCQMQTSV